jgi:ABC-type polysaccharide/polyol phosphate transport system ATPase subunit
MSAAATGVEFQNVWKRFRYGEGHHRLTEAIPAVVRRWFGRDSGDDQWSGQFWALQDVSFTVGRGTALGLIGPNGAGKSTVLKLLTRILRPTRGRLVVRGRVGALIEVAAGFHPDLTGRENVFLQGIIMGMPRRDIVRRFDEIVDFSGISAFIDTPVKRYSSGMQTRLGFAIAAHLDPDILVVDEALAVGDAAFQVKAFGRVQELVAREIPVIVVSHQLDAVEQLCTHGILLDRGRVVHAGTPRECISAYLHSGGRAAGARAGDGAVRIDDLHLSAASVPSGGWIDVTLACVVHGHGWVEPESVRIRLRAALSGEVLSEVGTEHLSLTIPEEGAFQVVLRVQANLQRGAYLLESFTWDRFLNRVSCVGPALPLDVRDGTHFDGIVQLNPTGRLVLPTQ